MKDCFKKLLVFIVFFSPICEGNAQSVGGVTSGSAIICANSGSGFIALNGSHGSTITWQDSSSATGGAWVPTNTTAIPSQSYSGLTTSTCYRAIVQDGSFPPDTSSVSCVDVYPPSIGGTITGGGTFCVQPGSGTGVLTLVADTGRVLFWQDSIANGGGWTTINDTTTTLNYSNFNQTTYYRAVVQNGSTCPSDTSSIASFIFDSVTVTGSVLGSDTVCLGTNAGTLHLAGKVGTVLGWLYSTDGSTWTSNSNNDTLQSYTNLNQTTWYEAIVKNGACLTDTSGSASIVIIPNIVSAGNDTTIFQGQSVLLNGIGAGIPLWSPSIGLDSIHKFKPIATPTISTLYKLTITDRYSCVSSDSVLVTVNLKEFKGIISNLFTPNGDGINDTWYIQDIENYSTSEVFVYNIYGNMVYTKKGYMNDWKGTYNGSDLPDGTYYYVLRFNDSDKISKGSLDILRSK